MYLFLFHSQIHVTYDLLNETLVGKILYYFEDWDHTSSTIMKKNMMKANFLRYRAMKRYMF